jgi:uncharacterized protein YqeY
MMMSAEQSVLAARIDADLKQAMRAQDNIAKLALRAVKTALTEASKSGSDHTLSNDQVMAVIQREAKRRREAAAEYDKVGAVAPAEQERAELAVLEQYLPRQMSEAEVEALARAVIAETGATTVRDLNKVMPVMIARVAGAADGKTVSLVVRRLLGA